MVQIFIPGNHDTKYYWFTRYYTQKNNDWFRLTNMVGKAMLSVIKYCQIIKLLSVPGRNPEALNIVPLLKIHCIFSVIVLAPLFAANGRFYHRAAGHQHPELPVNTLPPFAFQHLDLQDH